MSRSDQLRSLGFDRSVRGGAIGRESYLVACGQCDAAVINGVPVHETGCRNATRECSGCDAQIPARARYCLECSREWPRA